MSEDQSDEATRTSTDLPARFAGRQFGSYQLESLLAAGGMGEVYAAYDPRLRREVAVKVVPEAFADDPERLARLEREARSAAALNHPNILAVYDIGTQDGIPFIVMERVPGITLAEEMKRGRLSVGAALDIAIQIAGALAAVHAGGILHRDLKPLNVMLTPEGWVKLLDFGLAKMMPSEGGGTRTATLLTQSGQLFGTPAYMAPEQFGSVSDHRADIYGLGVMLFEMVTGRRPFSGHDILSVLEHVLTEPAPLPEDIDPSLPPALCSAITKCLAKDPNLRFASALDLLAELERIRGSLGQQTVTPLRSLSVRTRRAFRSIRRSRVGRAVMSAAAVALTALVAATGVWMWTRPGPPADRPIIAVLPLANKGGDAMYDYIGVGIADALTTRLSQLSSVSVVSREVARDAARGAPDRAKLARDIGATLLVEGTLARSGDRLRVELTLVRGDGSSVWSGASDARLSDPLAMERDLVNRLVTALGVTMSAEDRLRLTVPQTQNQEALDAYWRGMSFLERTDAAGVDQAIASFGTAIGRDPDYAVAHAALGAAFVRKYSATKDQAWMTRATESVMKALEIDPTHTEVRLSLANLYLSTGRNGSAVEELRRVLQAQPGNDEAHRRLGAIFESEGRRPEALEEYRAAIDARPAYWRNHDVLGIFYYRSGQLPDAIRAFTRVTELRPDSAQAFQRLGTAYAAQGNKAQARENLKRAIDITPDAASYSNLGTLLYAEGNFEEAAEAYRQAIRLRPNRALLHRNLGDTYQKLGRAADAQSEYREAASLARDALKVNPNDALVMAQLAVYEAKLGNRRDAEEHITRAMGINPSDPEVLFRRAAVFALAGDTPNALKAVSDAVAKGFAVDLVRDDDDLASLRSMPAFQSIISPNRTGSPKGARP